MLGIRFPRLCGSGTMTFVALGAVLARAGSGEMLAQGPRTELSAPAARIAAPKDFAGYWVSVVTQNWHLRMTVPPKGDFEILPLNAEARRIGNMWDPAKDRAAGVECKSYGAVAIMQVPGRLHIHWADENTLQVDTDSGM